MLPQVVARTMLYEIEGTSTRLLGTMHFVPVGQEAWVPYVRTAFDWSETVVVEMKLANALAGALVATTHPKALPNDLHKALAERWRFDSLGLTLEATNLPSIVMFAGSTGLKTKPGVEDAIASWMVDPESREELETPEEFAAATEGISSDDLIARLAKRFKEGDAVAQSRLDQMYRAWRGHNEAKIAQMNRAQLGPSIYAAVFDARNRNWAPRIAAIANRPTRSLVCVGVGHLVGPNSVREMLERNHGLRTKRIRG